MCGLAGIIGSEDPGRARAATAKMLMALAHRGPDAEGLETWPGAVLGHRRLAVFDLSEAGTQPMLSEDRSVGVLFNGAIYNFRSLRVELERYGYRFRSQTDTEVLLHGYRAWGIDELLQRLRGMFAIAIWDAAKDRLFLVRDRMGVKPLVYAVGNGTIAFASTVRALACAGFGRTIDDLGVAEFLEYGFVTDARTIYREVRKLPAASILEWHRGECRIREVLDAPPNQPTRDLIRGSGRRNRASVSPGRRETPRCRRSGRRPTQRRSGLEPGLLGDLAPRRRYHGVYHRHTGFGV